MYKNFLRFLYKIKIRAFMMILKQSINVFLIALAGIFSTHNTYADTTLIFTLEDFYIQILENHPVARQADLLSEQAKRELRVARGVMDPTLNSSLYRKELDGSNYFTLWENTFRIPLWFGADIRAGYERNTGFNVSGENYTPPPGLTTVGISIPLGQGLFFDQRRATIRQAELLGDLAEAERVNVINQLLLQAANDYWDWLFAYNRWNFHQEGFELAQFRLNAVKERAREGNLPFIDTVEARMEMQNRRVLLSQSLIQYQNASLMLSNYLWTPDNQPLEITNDVIPATAAPEDIFIPRDSLENLIVAARNNHPELIRLRINRDRAGIEGRLLTDRLKPTINLNYNIIYQGNPETVSPMGLEYFTNNYKLGIGFSFPIFLRSERGRLQLNNIRIRELDLEIQQSEREIVNQIQAYYNELLLLNEQVQIQEDLVLNTQIMRDGEQGLFEDGESNLFMINTREIALINNRIQLFDILTRYAKAKIRLQWAAGRVII